MGFAQELSQSLASSLLEETRDTIKKIAQFNQACPNSIRRPKFRRCTLMEGRISLFHIVKKNRIEIIAVRDNRRKPKF